MLVELLGEGLVEDELPADEGGEGQAAVFREVGDGAADEFDEDRLGEVGTAETAFEPDAEMGDGPAGIDEIEIELVGRGNVAFGQAADGVEIDLPDHAGLGDVELGLGEGGGAFQRRSAGSRHYHFVFVFFLIVFEPEAIWGMRKGVPRGAGAACCCQRMRWQLACDWRAARA